MAFEIVPAGRFGPSALSVNSCRIRGDGIAVVHREAAEKVGIDAEFVLLVDKDTKRIAVRKVHSDDDPGNVVKVRANKNVKGRDQVLLPIAAAMRMGGWTTVNGKAWRYHGQQRVVARGDDGLLIIILENPAEETGQNGRKRK